MHTPAQSPSLSPQTSPRSTAAVLGAPGSLWASTAVAAASKLEVASIVDRDGLRNAVVKGGLRLAVLELELLGKFATAIVESLSKQVNVLAVCPAGSAGAALAATAIDRGAIDAVVKPADAVDPEWLARLSSLVRGAAAKPRWTPLTEPHASKAPPIAGAKSKLIVIGSGNGGYAALVHILTQLPKASPGIVVVQHADEGVGSHLVERLCRHTELSVKIARDGEAISTGTVYLAPQNCHTAVRTTGTSYTLRVFDGPDVAGFRPSSNVLLDSAARYAGRNALGVLLDGIGEDGSRGLLALRQAGGLTVCQSPESSLYAGPAKSASEIHAVQSMADPDGLAAAVTEFTRHSACVA